MGVTGLWDILNPVKKSVNYIDLKGKKLAVDLAAWICDSENVKSLQNTVEKPYLRNLMFRILTFVEHEIELVFVLDGRAPELKWDTISKRLNSGSEGSSMTSARGKRSRLNYKFNECTNLLDALGIPWLTSEGEAEGLCAQLNKDNFVDGVITSDGDAFLYGAQKVYRNLITNKKGISAEEYDMADIEKELNYSREDLVAIALLLGCDYAKGVPGIGKTQAAELLHIWKGKNSLNEFRNWQATKFDENVPDLVKKPVHCSTCHHIGSKSDHRRCGCDVCGSDCCNGKTTTTSCTCEWHQKEVTRKKDTLIAKIKKAAMQVENFPDEIIIAEFLSAKKAATALTAKNLASQQPRISDSVALVEHKLKWVSKYATEKVLKIAAKWFLRNYDEERVSDLSVKRILKTRVQNRVDCVEVLWSIEGSSFDELSTIEPVALMEDAMPQLLKQFQDEKVKEKAAKSKKSKQQEPKKITDFFAAQKSRGIKSDSKIVKKDDEKPQKEASCVQNINYKSKTDEKEGKLKAVKSDVIAYREPLRISPELTRPLRAVTFTSSDSDSEIENTDSANNFTALENFDLTFSKDLNFSLGISSTPAKRTELSLVDMNISKTPLNTTKVAADPDSPMFLSLFERLKLRKENTNK